MGIGSALGLCWMYVVHTEVMPVAVLLQWLRCARPLVKVYRARLFVRAVPVSVRPESRLLTEWSGAVHRLAPILFQLSLMSGIVSYLGFHSVFV